MSVNLVMRLQAEMSEEAGKVPVMQLMLSDAGC